MTTTVYKVAATGKPKLIGKVKARLQTYSQQTVDAMAKTPFKYLMRYPDNITKSGRCMHHLISREAIGTPAPDPSAIFFRVNGEIVRFGRMEFAIVTQLRFGASSFDIYAQHDISIDSVYYRVFHGQAMSPDQLWKWYTRDSSFGGIEADDCVKISQVLIVAHIILGLSPTNSKIPDWVWVWVFKGVKHRMSAMNYHLFGNSLAFLGWIFCAFPEVGRDIGGSVHQNARPRGLRFTYANSGTYGEIDIIERSIEEVWMKLERPGDMPFDTEEIVPGEDLKSLAKWVTREMPQWGKIESWEEADEIIMVCYFDQHWVTCVVDLVQFTLEIWDSNQHKFTDHIIDLRAKAFLPVARIIPQVLKYVHFYDNRPDTEPVYSQWLHYHPDVNVIRQNDSESCGPLALKYAENRLRGVGDSPMASAAVQRYRNHITECIYKFSTDESTIDTSG